MGLPELELQLPWGMAANLLPREREGEREREREGERERERERGEADGSP